MLIFIWECLVFSWSQDNNNNVRPLRGFHTKFHSDISYESSLCGDNSNFKLKNKKLFYCEATMTLKWSRLNSRFIMLWFISELVVCGSELFVEDFFISVEKKRRMERYFWIQECWKGHRCAPLVLQFCWVSMFFCRQQYWTCTVSDVILSDIMWS